MFDTAERIGLGTYTLTGDHGTSIVETAIEEGYRHVDTARLYENEREVGAAIESTGVDRDDLFVATKIAHFEEPKKTAEYVRTAVEESFERLGLNRIDLLYHHWPRDQAEIKTVLPSLEEYIDAGIITNLGVSNYTIGDLELADDLVDVPIVANQVEMHPLLPQAKLRERQQASDTWLVAYSPLAQGEVFGEAAIETVADKHDVSEAVVSLAWLLSKEGVAAIPRSTSTDHLRDNLAAHELELDTEDIERIDAIERTRRCENPPWMAW